MVSPPIPNKTPRLFRSANDRPAQILSHLFHWIPMVPKLPIDQTISDISTSSKSNTIGAMLRVQYKLNKNSSFSTFSCKYHHHPHHYSCSINAAEEVPLKRLCLTKKFALIPFLLPACWPSNNFQTF